MEKDPRISALVHRVLTHSVRLQPGEKVYLEFEGEQTLPIMEEFIRETIKIGAVPFYFFNDTAHHIALTQNSTENQIAAFGRLHAQIMEQMDAYVVVRGFKNPYDKNVLSSKDSSLYSRFFTKPVHLDIRLKKRWCVLRYPTNIMASLAKMSTAEMEDFYFSACLLDYSKMAEKMEPLVKLMEKTDKVKIVGPYTHLTFSIKDIGVTPCAGLCNLPDGEVYTAPVKNSVCGAVCFNTETKINGHVFSNICLDVSNGQVVNARATGYGDNDILQRIIETDEGSCYFGEFAFGVNPYIRKAICENLFDEKIAGSFHMALGNCYDTSNNGNKSAIHWDLIQIQTPEHGGGKIWFDDVLVRADGWFVLPELEGLNPENLV